MGLLIVVGIVCLRQSQRPKSSSHNEKMLWWLYTSSRKHFCCDGDSSTSPMLTGKGSHSSSLLKLKSIESNLDLGPNLGLSPCSSLLVISVTLVFVDNSASETPKESTSSCTSGLGTGQKETWTWLPSRDMVEWKFHGQCSTSTMSAASND